MSKRKARSGAPNLPQETLERARRQAAVERGELPPEALEPEVPAPAPEEKPKPRPTAAAPVSERANPYRTVSASQRRAAAMARSPERRSRGLRVERGEARPAELDSETITELLDNPTVFVSEDELRRQYSHVLVDLRSMFVLAAGLIVALVVLAQVLPR